MYGKDESAISTLLELHGSILDQGDGYWIKIDAWRVPKTAAIPHGVRYSLTLHEPFGGRILGYDNAHVVKRPKRHRFTGRIVANDHKHLHALDPGVPYEFTDAQQLLVDFFADADRILSEKRS